MGPLALADLIGLDTCVAIMEVLHDGLGDPKYAPCPLLRQYVAGRAGSAASPARGFYAYCERSCQTAVGIRIAVLVPMTDRSEGGIAASA